MPARSDSQVNNWASEVFSSYRMPQSVVSSVFAVLPRATKHVGHILARQQRRASAAVNAEIRLQTNAERL